MSEGTTMAIKTASRKKRVVVELGWCDSCRLQGVLPGTVPICSICGVPQGGKLLL